MVFAMFPHQMVPKSFLLKLEHLKKVTQSSNFFLQDLTTLESLAEHEDFEKVGVGKQKCRNLQHWFQIL